jgi:hypothetical protein
VVLAVVRFFSCSFFFFLLLLFFSSNRSLFFLEFFGSVCVLVVFEGVGFWLVGRILCWGGVFGIPTGEKA